MRTTSSLTARTAAAARAAHLIVDQPPAIFSDTLAAALLGDEADEYVDYHRAHASHVVLAGARGQVVCRGRLAEDSLAAAISRGIRQYVILGAGLDSFAYRSALSGSVRIFEVDHQATQAWKRRQLAAARITVPENVTFVAADFETGSLAADLIRSGLDPAVPAFISWLGVTMYLTTEAIGRTFGELAILAPGSEVVADYMLPAGMRDEAGNTYVELVGPSSAERGEPFVAGRHVATAGPAWPPAAQARRAARGRGGVDMAAVRLAAPRRARGDRARYGRQPLTAERAGWPAACWWRAGR